MILVDSSVWINYLRGPECSVSGLLQNVAVITHPFVIGELALGSLKDRRGLLESLEDMPQAPMAKDREVLALIEAQSLHGKGIGYVDAHLLASTLLAQEKFWTIDKRLAAVAQRLGVAAPAA